MKTKALLSAIAVAEFGTGVGLLVIPSIVVELLFGHPLDSEVALVLGRLTGLALIAIGLTSWFEKSNTAPNSQLIGLLVYNLAVPVLLIYSFLVHGIGGILLWPAAVLHLVFAVWLIACLRMGRPIKTSV